MINITMWQCPKELIKQALEEHPIRDEVVTLNKPTGSFFYDGWEIKEEFSNTHWAKVLETLPYTIGEARIIKLKPGESYMAHADIDNRWHLNLTGEQSYLINLDDQKMHKQSTDGHWRYMFADKIHTASNFGNVDRLQLVVREPLKHSTFNNLVQVTVVPAYEQFDYRYQFDKLISPWLNLRNQECALDDFTFTNTSASFKVASHLLDDFKKLLTDKFTATYD